MPEWAYPIRISHRGEKRGPNLALPCPIHGCSTDDEKHDELIKFEPKNSHLTTLGIVDFIFIVLRRRYG